MLSQNELNRQNNASRIISFLTFFNFNSIARQCGFTKRNGVGAIYLLQILILYQFGISKNIFSLFTSRHAKDIDCSRSTMYELMSRPKLNWERLLTTFGINVIRRITSINGSSSNGYLVCDDTTLKRERSKSVELLSLNFDHVFGTFYKGFTELNLGWTDGISYVPLKIGALSAKKDKSVINKASDKHNKNTLAARRRSLARMSKIEVLIKFVTDALLHGCPASYILMDSWFTMDKVIAPIKSLGLDVIGMLKGFKANVFYENKGDCNGYNLKQLIKKHAKKKRSDICGSCLVYTKSGVALKIVFIKNRNDNKNILAIGSTDTALSERDIVTKYSYRWSCETHFYIKKQYLGFEKGCQARNYDHINAHCHITAIRFLIMQYLERSDKDFKLGGELYADLCEELRAHDFSQALNYIFTSFESAIGMVVSSNITNTKVREKIINEIHNLFLKTFCSLSNYVQSFLRLDTKLKYSDLKVCHR